MSNNILTEYQGYGTYNYDCKNYNCAFCKWKRGKIIDATEEILKRTHYVNNIGKKQKKLLNLKITNARKILNRYEENNITPLR